MARSRRLDVLRLAPRGLIDGPDKEDTPHDGAWESRGFHYRQGYAHTEKGRQKKTTSEIVASARVRGLYEWTQADGTVVFLAVCGSKLWKVVFPSTFTLLNTLTLGASTATNSGDTITITGGKCKNGVRVGDFFFFDDDTISAATKVTGVTDDNTIDCAFYAGSNHASASAFTLIRKLNDADVSMAVFGDKLYIADGVGPLHWLNAALDEFRPAGLIKPDVQPTTAVAADANGGLTQSSNYQHMIAYKDANGTVGPGSVSLVITTAAEADRIDVTCTDKPPPWATRRLLFRTFAGATGKFFRTTYDIASKLKTVSFGDPESTLTLDDTAQALRVDTHIGQYVKFVTSGTSYRIIDNSASTLTVEGDASGESGTDWITVLAEYALGVYDSCNGAPVKDNGTSTVTLTNAGLTVDAHIGETAIIDGTAYAITDNDATTLTVTGDASGQADLDIVHIHPIMADHSADTELDLDFEGPGGITNTTRSYNEPPPVGLKHLTKFRGTGRLAALEKDTGTRIWFSGRPEFAAKTGQAEFFGELEPEYWPHYHDAGPQDGDAVQGIIELGFNLAAVKRDSVWQLDQESSDVSLWGWGPIMGAERIGCVASKTIVVHKGMAYWLGRVGEELDLIRFDGSFARRFGRPKLGDCLDTMVAAWLTEATAVIFGGKLYISYTHTGNTKNSRTLRYDFVTRAFDIQPWGCGVFATKQSDSLLYCGDPTDLGDIFSVLGTAQDNGSDIVRQLTTGNVAHPEIEYPVHHTHIVLEVVID